MTSLKGWKEGDSLVKLFSFHSFLEAIAFVKKVAEKAEKLQHHPDILITYNKVKLTLKTHDAGKITEKDYQLAKIINSL